MCSLGFEPRCVAAPNRLKMAGIRARRVVYFEPSTNRADNRTNLPALSAALNEISDVVESLQSDDLDFGERLNRLLSLISRDKSREPLVYVDISVLSNRVLFRVLKAIFEANVNLIVIYSEAAVYHPTEKELKENWEYWKSDSTLGIERGVSEVFPSREYPGQHLDPLPDYLILFPSFKAERTRAVIARVDPSLLTLPGGKLFWIIGVPHVPEQRWRSGAMRKLNDIERTAPQAEVTTFDYKEALKRLEMIYADKWKAYNITISPLGSKLQAIGTAMFCYLHPDVRLVFAIPKEYNAALYSDGCANIWSIRFGSTARIRELLESVGALSIAD
jgi:hypothetical protein